MSYGMDGWNKPSGDLISRAAVLEKLSDLYWTEERFLTFKDVDSVFDRIKALPSAQPDKSKIEDCLYHIHRNTSVHTSAEGVVAIKHYMGKLWREFFGEENIPEWMS